MINLFDIKMFWRNSMNLAKFIIMSRNESLEQDEKTSILINLEHIISVKPIKMSTTNRDIIDGYWIRLSNGKKYRAIQVPKIILSNLEESLTEIKKNDSSVHAFNSLQ